MRRLSLLLPLALAAGCVSHLRRGDEAFVQGMHASSVDAWRRASETNPDAVDFRLALIHATEGTAFHDPERARALLEALAARSPQGPYGVAAARALEALARQKSLEERLTALEAELSEVRRVLDEKDAELQLQLTQAAEQSEKAAQESARLNAELQQLRDENAQLQQELEAIKSIDLRN